MNAGRGDVVPGTGMVLIFGGEPGPVSRERRSLERAGYAVRTAADAGEVMKAVARGGVDLLVVDQVLPGGSTGLDFYARLQEAGHGLPVVLVAERPDEVMMLRALRAGVDDYVTRSAGYLEYLPEAVGRAMARAGTRRRLEESELRLGAVIANAPIIVFALDREGVLTLSEGKGLEALGLDKGALVGQSIFEMPDADPRVQENVRRALAGEEFSAIMNLQGVTFEARYSPLLGEGGEVAGALGIATDTTERRRVEEELRLRNRVVTASTNSIVITDVRLPDYPIIYVNPAFEHNTGYAAEEALGRNCRFLQSHDKDQPAREELRAAVREGRETQVVIRNYRKDGTLFWNEVYVYPVRDENGGLTHFVGVQNDITERKRAEETLRQSEERYRTVVERTAEGIFLVDFDTGRVVEFNGAFREMLGYPPEELLYMSVHDLIADERKNVDRDSRRIREGVNYLLGERRYRRKDGSLVDVEASVTVVPFGDGEVACCVARDITGRKRTEEELRETNRRLRELAALRTDFTAMVAHEINSPLLAIRGYASMLAGGDLDPGARRDALAVIQNEIDLLNTLVSDVQTAATVERDDFTVEIQAVPLDALLADAAAFAETLPGDHPFVVAATARGRVWTDPERIGQVLRNLLSNAAKHSPPGAPVELRATETGAGSVRVEVADRGPGIHPDDVDVIFEKFGRGRDRSGQKTPGVGLGLYLSRRIVQAHGKELVLSNPEPGAGAVFTFELEALER